jgi:two-component system chemotaxis sensor kinase CheA
MDELLTDFLSETKEHIEGIETYLVLFEQNPHDSEAVTHIFRLVHTIKGTAGFLALVRLQTISHAAETLIDTLRNGAPPTATAVSLLLLAMDRIKLLIVKVGELEQEPEGDDRDIIGRIEDYLQGGQEEPSAEEPKPDVAEPEPDVAESDAAEPQKAKRRPAKAKRAKQQQPAGENAPASVPATAAASQPSKPEPAGFAEPHEAADVAPKAKESKPAQPADGEKKAKEAEQTPGKDKTPDTIRITVPAIQRIMDLVSELVLTRNQILELSRQHNLSQVKAPLERLSTVTSDLQDAVMRARMQPMSRLFASIPRLVRELSVELKKKYNLILDGADTELDRQLIEAIRDPLMHLIRNCADHGIETPQERLAQGKPEAGEISIAAYYESGQVHIEIADDGHGLDGDRIREKAVERGLGSPEAIARLSDEEIYRFILMPGFSTATKVTNVSGRGVGMDVVISSLSAIGGTIALQSSKGKGSKFILQIPLTLAIAPALVVKAAGQQFAIPQQCVNEAVGVGEDSHTLQIVENALVLKLRDEIIPVAELAGILGLPTAEDYKDKLVVILGLRGKKFGIVVDDVVGIQEIVVQPLGQLFSGLKVYSGNTILGDGSVILILDPAGVADIMSVELASEAVHQQAKEALQASTMASNLILFKAGSGAPKVVPRSAVLRIVRPKTSAIYEADGLYLYRCQDKLVPVLPVDGVNRDTETCLILIITLHDRTFGLWVDEVLDIVETAGEIQLASDSPSIIGTIDLRGTAVEFIDTGYYFGQAYQAAQQVTEAHHANLLLVGGDPGMQDMLSPVLTSAGHKVTAAETAEQANKLLQQSDFGVIVLDAKSRDSLDEIALSRQPNALRLVLHDGQKLAREGEHEGDVVINQFDRRSLLNTIAAHLEAISANAPKAANLNDAPLDRSVNFG